MSTFYKPSGRRQDLLPKAIRDNMSDYYNVIKASPKGFTGSWLEAVNNRTGVRSKLNRVSTQDITKVFNPVYHT